MVIDHLIIRAPQLLVSFTSKSVCDQPLALTDWQFLDSLHITPAWVLEHLDKVKRQNRNVKAGPSKSQHHVDSSGPHSRTKRSPWIPDKYPHDKAWYHTRIYRRATQSMGIRMGHTSSQRNSEGFYWHFGYQAGIYLFEIIHEYVFEQWRSSTAGIICFCKPPLWEEWSRHLSGTNIDLQDVMIISLIISAYFFFQAFQGEHGWAGPR